MEPALVPTILIIMVARVATRSLYDHEYEIYVDIKCSGAKGFSIIFTRELEKLVDDDRQTNAIRLATGQPED